MKGLIRTSSKRRREVKKAKNRRAIKDYWLAQYKALIKVSKNCRDKAFDLALNGNYQAADVLFEQSLILEKDATKAYEHYTTATL